MHHEAPSADALYVLGDLFDFWTGDEDPSEFAREIKNEFLALTDKGVPCYFIKGNRDFLIGQRFAKDTGISLLEEEVTIDLYGHRVVILHGDTLCTEDVRYLAFRRKVHQPWLQKLYKCLPFCLKTRIVSKIKQDIRQDKSTKSLDIMDVTQQEVDRVMTRHQSDLMIHGHTHRPNIHQWEHNGKQRTRVVLGDWYTQGSILVCSEHGYELQTRTLGNAVNNSPGN